jgi:hypothetical protein
MKIRPTLNFAGRWSAVRHLTAEESVCYGTPEEGEVMMRPTRDKFSRWLLVGLVLLGPLLIAACAAFPPEPVVLTDQSEVAERPEWEVGDRWVFRWKLGFGEGRSTVIVEDAAPGGYTLLTVEQGLRRYFTPDLEYIAAVEDDVITTQHVPPLPLVKFPLTAGLKWQQGGGAIPPGGT